MYSPSDRKETLDKLLMLLPQIPNVEGVILVGSGARGFSDEYSDIDLSVVVSPAQKTKNVWNNINHIINSSFEVFHYSLTEYGENNNLTLFILSNYLQIDVGVLSFENLMAKKPSWKVIFDRNNKVLEKMKNTEGLKKPESISIVARETIESLHYHTQNAVFAIKRNRIFRAFKEIEEIRELTLKLYGIYNNREIKHYREVDDLDDDFKEKLRATIPEKLTLERLSMSLVKNIDLYFEILKTVLPNNQWEKDKTFINRFINELLP